MDTELARFRRVDLPHFASAMYNYHLDQRESSRSLAVMRGPERDKIVIALNREGYVYYSVDNPQDHGDILAFILGRLGPGGSQELARNEVRQWLADKERRQAGKPNPELERSEEDLAAFTARWLSFTPYNGNQLQQLGFAPATIAAFQSGIRQDEKGAACFRHRNTQGVTGWELFANGTAGFAPGGTRSLFGVLVGGTTVERIVVTESALDALAYHQLHGLTGLYLSFAGAISAAQRDLITGVLRAHPDVEIQLATGTGVAGTGFAAWIAGLRPNTTAHQPDAHDSWLAALTSGAQKRAVILEQRAALGEPLLHFIGIPVEQFARSRHFYTRALAPLGLTVLREGEGWTALGRDDRIALRIDGRNAPPQPVHIGLAALDAEQVLGFHTAALNAGGKNKNAPTTARNGDYVAAVLDPDGHLVEVVCRAG